MILEALNANMKGAALPVPRYYVHESSRVKRGEPSALKQRRLSD